jgi:hypothetical protein
VPGIFRLVRGVLSYVIDDAVRPYVDDLRGPDGDRITRDLAGGVPEGSEDTQLCGSDGSDHRVVIFDLSISAAREESGCNPFV